MTTPIQVRVSRQYRSVIKDCQEQLEHLAETGAASQASHYLAQVNKNYFHNCIVSIKKIGFCKTNQKMP